MTYHLLDRVSEASTPWIEIFSNYEYMNFPFYVMTDKLNNI